MKLKANTGVGSDETSGFVVDLEGEDYNLGGFIEDAVKIDEAQFGKFQIELNNGAVVLEYDGKGFKPGLEGEDLDRLVECATARGGWGRMDFFITLKS